MNEVKQIAGYGRLGFGRWLRPLLSSVTTARRGRRYLIIAAASFFVLSPVAFFISHPIWAFACRPSLGNEEIVAYCHSERYGYYEHAAYALELEPTLVENFRKAEILTFGNSRMQFFLARPVAQIELSRLDADFHSAAFSYNEAAPFASELVTRLKPRPRAMIINVDPFFWDRMSPAAHEALDDSPMNKAAFLLKREITRLQRRICGSAPSRSWLCSGEAPVVLRKPDGSWVVDYIEKPDHKPFVENEERFQDLAASSQTRAEQFLNLFDTDRGCVIFTSVPSPASTRNLARDLARRLGIRFVAPRVEGLMTFDGSHLDEKSANRWAKAFFSEAGPVLERCVHKIENKMARASAKR
jgi:hypothetical protein